MALTKRRIQAIATKERIRNVAMDLMQTQSLEEISVNDICRQAGVGVGTFYHYFKSKDDIVLEVYNEMDACFLKFSEENRDKDQTPYDYVLQHCLCYARYICQRSGDLTRKVYALQSPAFLDKKRAVYATLINYLSQKQNEGVIPKTLDISRFADYVQVSLRGITFDWCLHNGDYDLIKGSLVYLQLALHSFAADLSGKG